MSRLSDALELPQVADHSIQAIREGVLVVAEAAARAVERIGLGEAEPPRAQSIPQVQSRPIRFLEDLIRFRMKERVRQEDGDLLLVLAVEEANPPGGRGLIAAQPTVHLGAGRAAMLG